MLLNKGKGKVRPGEATQSAGRTHESPDQKLGAIGLTGIGIGGIIGAGYFLGSGIVIRQAGPAILLTFLFGGLILAQVMGALATMATHEPKASYRAYVESYLGTFPSYILGWVVFVSGVLGLGSEAVAMATYARLWLAHVPMVALAVTFTVLALALNALGTRRVGQTEAVMSFLKITLLLAFVVVGVAAVAGALPHRGPALGLPLVTSHGGFMPHGVGPVLGASLIVVFSYSGVTAVAMATGRARHPRRDVPESAMATVFGVVFLYVVAMAVLLLLVPWQGTSTRVSPFTQALRFLPIPLATPLFNALILISSFSVMAGGFYATAWMLESLSRAGEAPKLFQSRKAGTLSRSTVIASGLGVLVSLTAAYVLPKSAYTDLTAAGSYFSLLNWLLILGSFLRWLPKNAAPPLRLAFGAPISTWVTIVAIVALGIQSARSPTFQPGLWTFLVVIAIVSGVYLVTSRSRTPSAAGST